MLADYPRQDELSFLDPRDADDEDLERVHAPRYVERVKSTSSQDYHRFDLDTVANRFSHAAARRAAGAVIACTESVVAGSHDSAFALVRPPGHHAEGDRAMGFCFFNSVAIAAEYARHVLECPRVAIFDFDVHHGNGTQHSFYDRSDVLYLSIHQDHFYPGTGDVAEIGAGGGVGYTVNLPVPSGTGDYSYFYLTDRILRPVLTQFAPSLILVSAGFDTHSNEPLAGMRMTTEGYGNITAILLDIADGIASDIGGRKPPLVFALEGGYDQEALAGGVSAVLDALSGETYRDPPVVDSPDATGSDLETRVVSALGKVWDFSSRGAGTSR
jgi:acetoin utilization deacetylase AcuC-like enzyme